MSHGKVTNAQDSNEKGLKEIEARTRHEELD